VFVAQILRLAGLPEGVGADFLDVFEPPKPRRKH
jgi:hypothetical protein